MSESEEPTVIDNRAAARAAREEARRQSLYDNDPSEDIARSEAHATRQAPVRWGPGADPSLDSDELAGFEEVKLEVLEHTEQENVDPFAGRKGEPSQVRCLDCRLNDYLIMDMRTTAQRIDGAEDDVKHALKMARPVARELLEPVYLLYCPGCHARAQMIESQMFDLRRPE